MSGAPNARNRDGDRFYRPPAVRKRREQKMLLQQQQREQEEKEKENGGLSSSVDSEKVSEISLSTASTSMAANDSVCSISTTATDCATNLDRFLQCTTPVVPSRCFSKTCGSAKGRKTRVVDQPQFFILDDLWEYFQEWSVYGAGVHILLKENESVVQYYVPFLSAIQLFVDPARPASALSKKTVEDRDVGSHRETNGEGSCDRDAERGESNRSNGYCNVTDSDVQSLNRLSLADKSSVDASSSEKDVLSTPGTVAFEFFERESPFIREPLSNKISNLASGFPGLKTLTSFDLLPHSWLSVAWYPIYRIPTGPTLQNLDACFLTYHSFSTPLSSKDVAASQLQNSKVSKTHHSSTSSKLSLPTFALASYRFEASVWENDRQKEQLLLQEAGSWLKLRQVEHPDYRFFINNYSIPLVKR